MTNDEDHPGRFWKNDPVEDTRTIGEMLSDSYKIRKEQIERECEEWNKEAAKQEHPGRWQSTSADYYREWSVTFGPDGVIRIEHKGAVGEHTAEGWLNLCRRMLPESVHIKEMVNAIHWHFGPGDAQKVIKRYLEQVNSHE